MGDLGNVEVAVEPEFDYGVELCLVAAGAHTAVPPLSWQGLVFVLPLPDLGRHASVASVGDDALVDDPRGHLE